MKTLLVFTLFMLGFASVAPAQSLYGSLVGTVTDDSSSVLARAQVTATQTETNFSRSTVTNDTGLYNIPNYYQGRINSLSLLRDFRRSMPAMSTWKPTPQSAWMRA